MTGGGQADYYAVLGVPREASGPEIRRAYRRAARQHHPDLNGDPLGPERFVAAARAYAVLADPVARARYDERSGPRPVPIRRSSAPPPTSRPTPALAERHGVLELTAEESAYVARFPLALVHGASRLVVPAGTADGDELMLLASGRLIVLHVRMTKKDLT